MSNLPKTFSEYEPETKSAFHHSRVGYSFSGQSNSPISSGNSNNPTSPLNYFITK
jgi:hypothetical protein